MRLKRRCSTCACIKISQNLMSCSLLCTSVSTAHNDRSVRSSKCTLRRYIQCTHMPKTVFQTEGRDPVVAQALGPTEKQGFCVVPKFVCLQWACAPSPTASLLKWQVPSQRFFCVLQRKLLFGMLHCCGADFPGGEPRSRGIGNYGGTPATRILSVWQVIRSSQYY